MDQSRIARKDLMDELMATLNGLPRVSAQTPVLERSPLGGGVRLDAEIHLEIAGRALALFAEFKKSVYPRDVRQILGQIRQQGVSKGLVHRLDAELPFLAADSISPGAKQLLREENLGYYDRGGSLFIPANGAFFFIDRPVPKALQKSVRTLFSGKRGQILHALLSRQGEWFGVNTIAALAQVSRATASQTFTALERFDWVTSRGRGPSKERCLVEPSALLDEWVRQTQVRGHSSERRYYVPSIEATALVERLAQACDARNVEYVITREAAAQRYAPHLSSLTRVACRMAQGRAAEETLEELNARRVSEGANLVVVEPSAEGEFLFKNRVGDVWLASPVQVYLDLHGGEGRASEMAQFLRQERLGF